jgi:hypothetical protein
MIETPRIRRPVRERKPGVSAPAGPPFIAYRIDGGIEVPLVAGWQTRPWLEEPGPTFAMRCLPMLIASQAGWFLLNPVEIRATWNGGSDPSDITIESADPEHPGLAQSTLGAGILSFRPGYLFRTAPGWLLQQRGPSNWPKQGLYPLEGLIESAWSPEDETANGNLFTVNWQFTQPNFPVTFAAGEPFGMIVPQRRDLVEGVEPSVALMADHPEMSIPYGQWARGRGRFNLELKIGGSEANHQGWQRDYFRGEYQDGRKMPEHQTKIFLRDFAQPAETADEQA